MLSFSLKIRLITFIGTIKKIFEIVTGGTGLCDWWDKYKICENSCLLKSVLLSFLTLLISLFLNFTEQYKKTATTNKNNANKRNKEILITKSQ